MLLQDTHNYVYKYIIYAHQSTKKQLALGHFLTKTQDHGHFCQSIFVEFHFNTLAYCTVTCTYKQLISISNCTYWLAITS